MRTVLIDNEPEVLGILQSMIENHFDQLEIIGTANGVTTGLDLINTQNPDLVFLDVEMDDGTGFDLLQNIDKMDFHLIFVTAHDKYAIQAIRYSAIDYLLKPLNIGELRTAIKRVGQTTNTSTQVNHLIDSLSKNESPKKIILKSTESIHVIPIDDILCCEANGSYTTFKTMNHGIILVSGHLKEYEKLLENKSFFRPHHSYLINVHKILRFEKADGGLVIMADETQVPVSTRKKDALLKAIHSLG